MFRILATEDLCPNTRLYTVEAPAVARNTQPGQFAIVQVDERGERVPFSICNSDKDAGIVQFIIQAIGSTTLKALQRQAGDSFFTVLGPLGHPTEIGHFGTVVLMGGGFGVGAIYPVGRAMRAAGNTVISMFGARHQGLLFWEDHLQAVSDEVLITTNDGSHGRQGLVIDPLREMLEQGREVSRVFAVGPVPMMRAVSDLTRPYGVRTLVSLNPIMVDGTGMCGACRINLAGEVKFACIDGPDFDGHLVDWDTLLMRQKFYVEQEKVAYELAKQAVGVA